LGLIQFLNYGLGTSTLGGEIDGYRLSNCRRLADPDAGQKGYDQNEDGEAFPRWDYSIFAGHKKARPLRTGFSVFDGG